jgi:hypothetical protein
MVYTSFKSTGMVHSRVVSVNTASNISRSVCLQLLLRHHYMTAVQV